MQYHIDKKNKKTLENVTEFQYGVILKMLRSEGVDCNENICIIIITMMLICHDVDPEELHVKSFSA